SVSAPAARCGRKRLFGREFWGHNTQFRHRDGGRLGGTPSKYSPNSGDTEFWGHNTQFAAGLAPAVAGVWRDCQSSIVSPELRALIAPEGRRSERWRSAPLLKGERSITRARRSASPSIAGAQPTSPTGHVRRFLASGAIWIGPCCTL